MPSLVSLPILSSYIYTDIGLALDTYRFTYDGKRLTKDDTPKTLEMDLDDDNQVRALSLSTSFSCQVRSHRLTIIHTFLAQVDAHVMQLGGCVLL